MDNSNSGAKPQRGAAVALSYSVADAAPRVVAKGYGAVAENIIARAREAGLYVHESPALVSLLMHVDLDSQIPPQLYQAVAELLVWIHAIDANASGLYEHSFNQWSEARMDHDPHGNAGD